MIFGESVYEGEDFSHQDVEMEELSKVRFVSCDLSGVDFSSLSSLRGCVFDRCDLSSAGFNGVAVADCAFLSCSFSFADFFAATFTDCKMTGSSFRHVDCTKLNISGGDWSYTDLRLAEFQKQRLEGIDFRGADLTGSRWISCRIADCNFTECMAHGMSVRDSDLRGSILQHGDLLTMELTSAKVDMLQCVALAEAMGAKYTI